MSTRTNREYGSHPTQTALLDAGLRLAARHGLSNMTVDQVVTEANVAKGTYYVHFESRKSYLLALYRRWHQVLLQGVYEAISGKTPGAERLRVATDAYMDACLAGRQVQAVLVAARTEPAIKEEASKASTEAASLLAPDLETLGFPHPLAAAQLYVSATIAAALIELDQGCRSAEVRESLHQLAVGPRWSSVDI